MALIYYTRRYKRILLAAMIMVMAVAMPRCRKAFTPAVFSSGANYLVVDGFINVNPGGISTIILSRTAEVSDSAINTPELHAAVFIQNGTGASYLLTEQGNGIYNSAVLNLGTTGTWRVFVKTSNGSQYQSDLVPVHPTPPIDSVTWKQDADQNLTIYVNTHDPANNTHYYRWTYAETWQYSSSIYSEWGVANGLIYHRDSITQEINTCWITVPSTNILLGNSTALSQDVISEQPINMIPHDDIRLNVRYSILVNQYALTTDAYNYWQIIEKNTQQLGGLFDEEPSQLIGNIHCLNNPNEPVIGYMTATSMQQKRILIDNHDLLPNWVATLPDYNCHLVFTYQNPTNFAIWPYPDTSYAPVYYQSGGGLAIAKKVCVDCTLHGGVNVKPSYW